MTTRTAIFGTFDIGNFGDLLFPFVAERKLSEMGAISINRFSYRMKLSQSWYYDVVPIQDFPDHAGATDLAIVGGGHLVHFRRLMGSQYLPTDKRVPHPLGFWWVPALACSMSGIPVALNAVSVDEWHPKWARDLMKSFVDVLDYIAVRDRASQRRLQQYAAAGTEITVVPDSVFSISDLITRGELSDRFVKYAGDIGLTGDYIIVQPSFGLRRFSSQIDNLLCDAVAQGLDVLELPIFAEMVDPVGLYGKTNIKQVTEWPEPLLLAELIANSRAVVGLSLHLSIVASAYGIPVHRPRYAPESKFSALDGLRNISYLDSSPNLTVLETADLSEAILKKDHLNAHWRRIYECAGDGRQSRQLRGWDQILATPEMFRRGSGLRDRLETFRLESIRRRQLLALAVRSRSTLR